MNESLDKLLDAHCRPITQNESPLNLTDIEDLRELTPSWQYCANENVLCQTFRFRDYKSTIAFVNVAAEVADNEDHHPEMEVGYNRCKINFSTHSVNGITMNDFICAAKIDARFKLS